MFLPIPKPIRKLLAILRGSVSPALIFMSVFLGFWFGMLPGWSGLHTVLVVVVVLLNVHVGMFLLSAGFGKSLCLAAAPVLYHVGTMMHEHVSFILRALAAIPILGITDYSKYALAGALVLGPIAGAVAGLLMAQSVIQFRKGVLKLDEKSKKFRTWYWNTWVRVVDRLLVGKRTKDVKALFSGKTKILRKAGVGLAVVILGISAAVSFVVKDQVMKDYATKWLSQANGAEVNVGEVGLSLARGHVLAAGIDVTDPQKPQNNQVQVGRIEANTSMYDLLIGRLVMEKVEVSGVRFDEPRQTPGKVLPKPESDEDESFDPNEHDVDPNQTSKLEKYFSDAKKLKEWLRKLKKYLPKGKKGEGAAVEKTKPDSYLGYLEMRADVPPSPRVLARQILMDKVVIPSKLFGDSRIVMENLSDAMAAAGLPVKLEMASNESDAKIGLTLDYSDKNEDPNVTGVFGGIDLRKMGSDLDEKEGLTFDSGVATGTFVGRLTQELIDLKFDVHIENLQAKSGGDGILGLNAQQTGEVLEVLKELRTTIQLVGPLTEPRIVFDTKGLTDEFKQALVKAGKQRLIKEIDDRLGEEFGDKVPDQLKDVIKDEPKKLIEGIGNLLGGKKDQ